MDPFLHRLDLNLLKSLQALLKERSVTKAAERMFVTQSAMSKSLRRLREALNDPLLIQTSNGLTPTPYAQQLTGQLESIFTALETCLIPDQFNPANYRGTLRIAAPEPFALGLVPGLIQRLRRQAPLLDIELIHLPDSYLKALSESSIDFVTYLEQDYSDDFTFHRLFSARPVIAYKKNHPLANKKKVTIADLCKYPKLAFHSPNVPPLMLNEVLARLEENDFGEKTLEVLMTTSHFLVALRMLRASDAFMVSPDFVFREPIDGIKTQPIDHIEMFKKLSSNVGLIQSKYTLNSSLHRWVVEECLSEVSANDT